METIFKHRSIRKYKDTAIPQDVLTKILEAGTRASTTGNMQLYSMIVTTDPKVKEELWPCHFNQPMIKQAPVIITFCVDIHRFSKWCEQREAQPQYDNLQWFLNGTIDALLASQNVTLEAEANGLGICYIGTTTYTADKICEVLHLPHGVIPITTISVGYPDECPPLTDRLPLEAVVHYDTYKDYSPEEIDRLWAERENSDETKHLLAVNDLPNLARIFTERRYKGADNLHFSKVYMDLLKKQGFLNQ